MSVRRLNTAPLAAPHGLHDAIAAEIAWKDGATAGAVAGHENHDIAKLPPVLGVTAKVGAIRPAIVGRRVHDAYNPAVECAEDFNEQ